MRTHRDVFMVLVPILALALAAGCGGGKRSEGDADDDGDVVDDEVAGDVPVDTVTDTPDDFADVESRSWKERTGTSIRARGVERFYRDVSDALALSGSFLPFWLELDGRVVAFLYGAVHDGAYYAMKTSFDEAFSRLSPGIRLFNEAVRHAFGAGLARFDFLGERARWKDEWATGWLRHVNVRLYPRTPGGAVSHLIDSRVRPLARRLRGGRSR